MDLDELKMMEYMALVREWWDAINEIKGHLSNDELELAVLAYRDMPEPVQRGLWKATTKGGVWTIEEREKLRTSI